jgi:hypothetical protein
MRESIEGATHRAQTRSSEYQRLVSPVPHLLGQPDYLLDMLIGHIRLHGRDLLCGDGICCAIL